MNNKEKIYELKLEVLGNKGQSLEMFREINILLREFYNLELKELKLVELNNE